MYCTGSGAPVCSRPVNKASHSANRNYCSDSVKGFVVVTVYQPSCVSLAQGISSATTAAIADKLSTLNKMFWQLLYINIFVS